LESVTLIGKAWRGVRQFVQDIRIDADYPRYELEQRRTHEAAASRRFDTTQLEREIGAIRRSAEAEGLAAYGPRINELGASIKALQPAITQLRWQLDLLTRDYRQELDQLYGEKASLLKAKQELREQIEELRKERSEAHDELSDAYDELEKAKSSIDSWYAKSDRTPLLFGNGGRRLPKRSIFGQSFGDLEGYKADRSRACDEIGACKAAISDVVERQKSNAVMRAENKEELNRVFESIRAVKEARQCMFDLKDQGFRRHQVEAQLSGQVGRETVLKAELDRCSWKQAEYVKQRSIQKGIEERQSAVEALKLQRSQFMSAFCTPAKKEERRAAHREWWMRQNQVGA
jgi:chromosome segregation ATPase